jgi:CRISPR-associated endonuclease/helicase Cas3
VNSDGFSDFFKALHGFNPFPWQQKLAHLVCNGGDWPALNLPTSSGKTAVMDIALFHLALEAGKDPVERRAPRRIFFVVDRRLVVDEAADRAQRIANRLNNSAKNDGILHEVATRLKKLSATEHPLAVLRLRGGVPREPNPFSSPLQPMIILSTVDQLGSRLMFRGYGISEFARPIHAGLAGEDSLIILDEAHLSQSFLQSLDLITHYRSDRWADSPICTPFAVVPMTATPRPGWESFALSPADGQDKVLNMRLSAHKPAKLIEISSSRDDTQDALRQMAETVASHARELMQCSNHEECPVIGIVVNRVATARAVFELLRNDAEAILLTGRSRPYDRDLLIAAYLPRIRAGRTADVNTSPLYVVATQTIEVGADLDFDAMVTEAAPMDALRQRFGRLNRLGRLVKIGAVIVFDKTAHKDDPVYGKSIGTTWKWLTMETKKSKKGSKKVDFGLNYLALPDPDTMVDLNAPAPDAPVLMPAHVDLLAQTSPEPEIEPDIAALLHGVDTRPADVQVIWRGDMPVQPELSDSNTLAAIIALLPPREAEAVQLPVWTVRAWLEGLDVADSLNDTESGQDEVSTQKPRSRRKVLVWRGLDESRIVSTGEIKPGDTIIVPASWGGLDRFGWCPTEHAPVVDIAEEVFEKATGRTVLRVHSFLVTQWFIPENGEAVKTACHILEDLMSRTVGDELLLDLSEEFVTAITGIEGLLETVRGRIGLLSGPRRIRIYPSSENSAPTGFFLSDKIRNSSNFTDEDDTSSQTVPTTLSAHCEGVNLLARQYAEGCGLPDEIVDDIALAGLLHDLGKADPRFQIMLYGGDRIAARRSGQLLAKSAENGLDKAALNIIRQRAGYPKGGRHECFSAVMAAESQFLNKAHDPELVIYLIGTHHGRGRPFMPVINDDGIKAAFTFKGSDISFSGKHGLERLDSGWTERFWKLVGRYGYWGLAYLETVLRMADHRQSAEEMGNNG